MAGCEAAGRRPQRSRPFHHRSHSCGWLIHVPRASASHAATERERCRGSKHRFVNADARARPCVLRRASGVFFVSKASLETQTLHRARPVQNTVGAHGTARARTRAHWHVRPWAEPSPRGTAGGETALELALASSGASASAEAGPRLRARGVSAPLLVVKPLCTAPLARKRAQSEHPPGWRPCARPNGRWSRLTRRAGRRQRWSRGPRRRPHRR